MSVLACNRNNPFSLLVVSMPTAAPAVAVERSITVTGPAAIPQGSWGTYHALIIGIDEYQQWPQLMTSVKDARCSARCWWTAMVLTGTTSSFAPMRALSASVIQDYLSGR